MEQWIAFKQITHVEGEEIVRKAPDKKGDDKKDEESK